MIGVLDNHNCEKALSHVAFSATEGKVLHHRRFGLAQEWPLGAVVELVMTDDKSKVLRARQIDHPLPSGVGQIVVGTYSVRDDQSYGFVRDAAGETIFVPPEIRQVFTIESGIRVRCTAVRSLDRKRGVERWKAVALDIAD